MDAMSYEDLVAERARVQEERDAIEEQVVRLRTKLAVARRRAAATGTRAHWYGGEKDRLEALELELRQLGRRINALDVAIRANKPVPPARNDRQMLLALVQVFQDSCTPQTFREMCQEARRRADAGEVQEPILPIG